MRGAQQFKFSTLGSLFGTERSTFSATSEMFRHTNRAENFVSSGRYQFFDETPQSSMEGSAGAATTGRPVITASGV